MKRTTAVLASIFCRYTRNFLLSSPQLNPNRNPPVPPLTARYFGHSFFSSDSQSSKEPNFGHTQKPDRAADDVDLVSKEELRKQIQSLSEGDEDAIREIFESILKRKLAGIDDDDLMEEHRPGAMEDDVDDMEDEEHSSDLNESDDSDTDEEVR